MALDVATFEAVLTVEAAAHGHPAGTRVRMSCWRAEAAGEPRPCGEIAELAWLGPEALDALAPAAQLAARAVFDRAVEAPGSGPPGAVPGT